MKKVHPWREGSQVHTFVHNHNLHSRLHVHTYVFNGVFFLPKRNQTEWNWVCVQTWDRTSTSHRHEGRVARQQCHPSQRQQLDHVFLLTELTTHRWNSICFYCFLLLNWPQIYIPDESRNLSTMVLCTSWEVRQRKILPPGFEFFYCRPPQLTREHCSSCSCVLRLFLEFGLDFWVSICHPPRLSFNNFKFCRPTKNFRNKNNNEKPGRMLTDGPWFKGCFSPVNKMTSLLLRHGTFSTVRELLILVSIAPGFR